MINFKEIHLFHPHNNSRRLPPYTYEKTEARRGYLLFPRLPQEVSMKTEAGNRSSETGHLPFVTQVASNSLQSK